MQSREPIDVVIAWVDGNDPVHKKKMQPYLNKFEFVPDDLAGPTRFRSEGEIFFCVASILRFAPFVRKIYIVTDQQNPNIDGFIQTNFPDNKIPVVIIDHAVIFNGYEEVLPTFNSLSIETCLYRIPDLSENFVYFNDDFFLLRPISYDDWFVDDKAVAYGYWRSIALDRLLWYIKPKRNGHKPFGFKDSMINAAKSIGMKPSYFHILHTPQPMNKSVLEQYYDQHPDKFISNISHKFRNETQFNPQSMFYMLASQANKCIQKSESKLLLIKPLNRGKSYVERKIKAFEMNAKITFCCIESIDLSEKEDQSKLFDWLRMLLNVTTVLL
jgi:hypothetical protein